MPNSSRDTVPITSAPSYNMLVIANKSTRNKYLFQSQILCTTLRQQSNTKASSLGTKFFKILDPQVSGSPFTAMLFFTAIVNPSSRLNPVQILGPLVAISSDCRRNIVILWQIAHKPFSRDGFSTTPQSIVHREKRPANPGCFHCNQYHVPFLVSQSDNDDDDNYELNLHHHSYPTQTPRYTTATAVRLSLILLYRCTNPLLLRLTIFIILSTYKYEFVHSSFCLLYSSH